jgi:hypothetical protein
MPTTVTGTGTTYTAQGTVKPNVPVYFSILASPSSSSGESFDSAGEFVTSGADGVYTINMIVGASYILWRGSAGYLNPTEVGFVPNTNFDLPIVFGPDDN